MDVFENIKKPFLELKEQLLNIDNAILIDYKYSSANEWDLNERDVSEFLKNQFQEGNIYCIFSEINRIKVPMYVGERESEYLYPRLRQHLVKKSENTGSQLENVKDVICRQKGNIYVSCVQIKPEYMRHSLEQFIISEGNFQWNTHVK